MIKLSNRLQEISNYIKKEDNVIDIGCDHALLDIYLAKKYDKTFIASDLREGAINNAEKNIKKYKMEKKVILRKNNGLDSITEKDNLNTVIISGMGSYTIINILKKKNKLSNINKIIIQSNNNSDKVRKYLTNNGYYIEEEKIVYDKNIFYIIIVFKKGIKKHSKMDIIIGKFKIDDISKKYIDMELKKNILLLKIIPITDFITKINIKRKIYYLNIKKNSIK